MGELCRRVAALEQAGRASGIPWPVQECTDGELLAVVAEGLGVQDFGTSGTLAEIAAVLGLTETALWDRIEGMAGGVGGRCDVRKKH